MAKLSDFPQAMAGIRTSLPPEQRSASYDRLALGYDWLVGNGLYNRLVWGCPKSAYRRHADTFLDRTGPGEILDFGCGSLVFTAAAYRGWEPRLVLFDRSLGMLARAQRRLPEGRFLQGDAFNAPFADGSFAGVCGWGMLHVFGSASGYLQAMQRLAAPGAPVAIGTLVLAGRKIGDRMLAMLERRGEASMPETPEAVTAAFENCFRLEGKELCGNMLFLHGTRR